MYDSNYTPSEVIREIREDIPLDLQHNREINPRDSDIYRLFSEFRLQKYGTENGPKIFEKLRERFDEYDATKFLQSTFLSISKTYVTFSYKYYNFF